MGQPAAAMEADTTVVATLKILAAELFAQQVLRNEMFQHLLLT
jgi:hypothetical protein